MRTAVRNCVSFNYGEFNARPVDWRTGSATGASRPATLHMAVALHAAGLSHSEQKRQTERRLNCQQICRQWFSGWQAAYDAGSYDLAWTMFPCEDHVVPGERNAFPPNPADADPFATLMEAEELAAGMSYLKDVSVLAKARAERRLGAPSGGGDGADAPPKRPPKKQREKAPPAAQAKSSSA